MAGSLASINIQFAVDLKQFRSQLQAAARDSQKMASQFSSAGQTMTLGLTAPLLGLGAASLKTFGDLEALKKGLISVMGSATAAESEFEKLKEVAKLPGLGLEEAVRGSVNLQAAGFSADEARTSLLAFGNALATVGKGKRELDLVTLALTQLNNKERGFGQDLRQITEQLPQLRAALTAAFGTADSEKIAELGVTGKQVVQLITKEFLKLPKVTAGLNNAFENFLDSTKRTLAELGQAINKALNVEGFLNSVSDTLDSVAEEFRSLSPEMQKFIVIAGGITAAIGPVLVGIGGILKLVPLVTTAITALTTTGAFLAANFVTIAAVIGVAFLAYKAFSGETKKLSLIQQEQNKISDLGRKITRDATLAIVEQKTRLAQLVAIARDENAEQKEKEAAIKEINKISPEYLGNITLETINTEKATAAIDKYNAALLRGAKARAAQQALEEFYAKQIEREKELAKLQIDGAAQAKKLAESTKGNAALEDIRLGQQAKSRELGERIRKSREISDKQEEQFLLSIINGNKDYLKLLDNVNEATGENLALTNGPKVGTIAYYEAQIKKLKELQAEFETTPEGVAALEDRVVSLQEKIDRLNGVRVKVTSVFEGLSTPDAESTGSIEAYDKQIEKLRQLQNEVATTSDSYYDLETAIAELQLEKEIKFDLPNEELNTFSDNYRNFGQKFLNDTQQIQERAREFSESVTASMKQFAESAIAGFAETIGQMAVGKATLGDVFAGIASLIADFIINVGKSLIAVGVAGIAFQSALSNPAGALITGALVVAAGSAFKAIIGSFNDAGAFANGGIVGGSSFYGDRLFARVNSGEMILNEKQQKRLYGMIQPAGTNVSVGLDGNFRIAGNDLELVLNRVLQQNNRKR
jgi:tape measure domain-containing protein